MGVLYDLMFRWNLHIDTLIAKGLKPMGLLGLVLIQVLVHVVAASS